MKRIIHTGVYAGGVAEKVFKRLFGEETPLCRIDQYELRLGAGTEWFAWSQLLQYQERGTMLRTNVTTACDGEVVLSTYGGEWGDSSNGYFVYVAWRFLNDRECMKYVASILKRLQTHPAADLPFDGIPAEDVELVRKALADGAGSLPKSEIERVVGRPRDPVETELYAAYEEEAMRFFDRSFNKIRDSRPDTERRLAAAYNKRAAKIASRFGVKWPAAKYFIGRPL